MVYVQAVPELDPVTVTFTTVMPAGFRKVRVTGDVVLVDGMSKRTCPPPSTLKASGTENAS
jgi:hypothetical protein